MKAVPLLVVTKVRLHHVTLALVQVPIPPLLSPVRREIRFHLTIRHLLQVLPRVVPGVQAQVLRQTTRPLRGQRFRESEQSVVGRGDERTVSAGPVAGGLGRAVDQLEHLRFREAGSGSPSLDTVSLIPRLGWPWCASRQADHGSSTRNRNLRSEWHDPSIILRLFPFHGSGEHRYGTCRPR